MASSMECPGNQFLAGALSPHIKIGASAAATFSTIENTCCICGRSEAVRQRIASPERPGVAVFALELVQRERTPQDHPDFFHLDRFAEK